MVERLNPILYDNAPGRPLPGFNTTYLILVGLIGLGAMSMLSYWLMVELARVWRAPFEHTGYTAFITASFLGLHGLILAAVIWVLVRIYRLAKVLGHFIALIAVVAWRIILLAYDKLWMITLAARRSLEAVARKVR